MMNFYGRPCVISGTGNWKRWVMTLKLSQLFCCVFKNKVIMEFRKENDDTLEIIKQILEIL